MNNLDPVIKFCPQLRKYAYQLTRNLADSEDLLQNTLERAWKHREKYRDGNLLAWLKCIMRNKHFERNRSPSIRALSFPEGETEFLDPPYPCAGEDYCSLFDVQKALDRLPAAQREALCMHRIEGLSYNEIAEAQGVELGTVRSRINRADAALHAQIKRRRIPADMRAELAEAV